MTEFAGSQSPFRELTDDERTLFAAWRSLAHEKMPYYENGLYSLAEVACDSREIVDTFAVDQGLRLYINFGSIAQKQMSLALCSEALLHEIGHLVGDHASLAEDIGVDRTDGVEQEMWNYAGDCAINDDLRDAGCTALAQYGVLPAQINEPDYQTPIYYMRRLRESRTKNEQPNQDAASQDEGESSDSGAEPYSGCGSISGGRPMPVELPEDGMSESTQAVSDFEKQQISEQIAIAIQGAKAQGAAISDQMVDMAEMVLAPSETPWESILMSFITSSNAYTMGFTDPSFNVVNRRYPELVLESDVEGEDDCIVILPGYTDPTPRLGDVLDTSGSMDDDDIFTAMSEIDAIAKRLGLGPEDHTVTQVDNRVHETIPYVDASSIKARSGYGGTSMTVGIEHLANLPLDERPSVIVVCTDGMTDWPEAMINNVPVVNLTILPRDGGWSNETSMKRDWPVPGWIRSVYVTQEKMALTRERQGVR